MLDTSRARVPFVDPTPCGGVQTLLPLTDAECAAFEARAAEPAPQFLDWRPEPAPKGDPMSLGLLNTGAQYLEAFTPYLDFAADAFNIHELQDLGFGTPSAPSGGQNQVMPTGGAYDPLAGFDTPPPPPPPPESRGGTLISDGGGAVYATDYTGACPPRSGRIFNYNDPQAVAQYLMARGYVPFSTPSGRMLHAQGHPRRSITLKVRQTEGQVVAYRVCVVSMKKGRRFNLTRKRIRDTGRVLRAMKSAVKVYERFGREACKLAPKPRGSSRCKAVTTTRCRKR